MGKRRFAVVLITVLCTVLVFTLSACSRDGSDGNETQDPQIEAASYTLHDTVAVHDPSIVLAYEDAEGNTYPSADAKAGLKKVYFVFGTQIANAKSYDLVNWTFFENNLGDSEKLYAELRTPAAYSSLDVDTILGNSWAPDVIYNRAKGKWTMYLSVNGSYMNTSSIVLLEAESLNGNWSYAGTVVWSGFHYSDKARYTDFGKVCGSDEVPERYGVSDEGELTYMVNAIDPAVFYDEEGELKLIYGSWYGGIYMLELDEETGLRDYGVGYATEVEGEVADGTRAFTVYSDEYFGKHIAGGAGSSGEGSYIEYIDGYYYLFVSYGGYGPRDGYNMRYYRSRTPDGEYLDAQGDTALYKHAEDDDTFGNYDDNGIRVMSGYGFRWWEHNYIAQGHNSVFTDDDGKHYVVYHNKFTDGTVFHVMKVHELLVTPDGWLVAAPFEAIKDTDNVITGSETGDLAGTYGLFVMTCDNGTYRKPCTETEAVFDEDGTIAGDISGSWEYDKVSGAFAVETGGKRYSGYVLMQTMEGTTAVTTAIAAVCAEEGETLWAYMYPSKETALALAASKTALPEATADITLFTNTYSYADELWYDEEVTATRAASGYVGDGETFAEIATSPYYAEYSRVNYGSAFLAMPGLNDDGFSISFDYTAYGDDWVTVIEGENVRVNLAVMQYFYGNTAISVFESMTECNGYKAFADEPHKAFYSSEGARAAISVNGDGSISFYRDGVKVLEYGADTEFDYALTNVGEFAQKLIEELRAGTLRMCIDVENVVIAAPITDGVIPEYTVTAEGSDEEAKYIQYALTGVAAVLLIIAVALAAGAAIAAIKRKRRYY